jgi:C4-dicarboxylate transporter, DctM subunit
MQMSSGLELCLIGLILVFLLASGQWIVFALGIAGMVGIVLGGGLAELQPLGYVTWNSSNNFNLTAIPLFVLMGELILQSGASAKFYRSLGSWFNWISGGLLQVNVLASALFASLTGVSVASAASLGTIAIASQKRQGYDQRMIFGSLAGGGTLAVLIPPSIPLIIYGAMTETSIVKLFVAGIIPGVILTGIFMIYIGAKAFLNPKLVPDQTVRSSWREKFAGLKDILPLLLIAIVILFGIYDGLTTPTEAGAIGALCAFILTIFNLRGGWWLSLKTALSNSVKTTCMLLSILVGAQILAYSLVSTGLNHDVTDWIVDLQLSKYGFLVAVFIVYLILGCFMDPISILVLTLPIVHPIIVALGFSSIWFGIMLVVLIEVGLLTPPVGINLFVIQGVSDGGSFEDVVHGSLPYVVILLFFLAALTVFQV